MLFPVKTEPFHVELSAGLFLSPFVNEHVADLAALMEIPSMLVELGQL
jgi:hypothetical protein